MRVTPAFDDMVMVPASVALGVTRPDPAEVRQAREVLAGIEAEARRARDLLVLDAETDTEPDPAGVEPVAPVIWFHRSGRRVAAAVCVTPSLEDALDLVLNAVPTYAADAVDLAFEGPRYDLPAGGGMTVNSLHLVRRERSGRWFAACLPYQVKPSRLGTGTTTAPAVVWNDGRLPGTYSAGAPGNEVELAGLVAAALEEAFAREPLWRDMLVELLDEKTESECATARRQADDDVTEVLRGIGRGRWDIEVDGPRRHCRDAG
jgi:hypothetical protein